MKIVIHGTALSDIDQQQDSDVRFNQFSTRERISFVDAPESSTPPTMGTAETLSEGSLVAVPGSLPGVVTAIYKHELSGDVKACDVVLDTGEVLTQLPPAQLKLREVQNAVFQLTNPTSKQTESHRYREFNSSGRKSNRMERENETQNQIRIRSCDTFDKSKAQSCTTTTASVGMPRLFDSSLEYGTAEEAGAYCPPCLSADGSSLLLQDGPSPRDLPRASSSVTASSPQKSQNTSAVTTSTAKPALMPTVATPSDFTNSDFIFKICLFA